MPGFVGEGVAADDGLVALHLHAGDVRNQPAGRHQPSGIDIRCGLVIVLPRAQRHDDFFQRAVAGAFADAVDRTLDLPCPVLDRRQAIAHGQAEIVVAMDADHRPIDVRHALAERADHAAHLLGHGVADGVGNVDGRGPGVDGRGDHFAEEINLGAGGVFGRELDVWAIARGSAHAGHGPANDLGLVHLELELAMDGAGGQEDVNASLLGVLQRLPGTIDVLIVAASQPADDWAANLLGDSLDGIEIAMRGDGEAGLDDVDAQLDQGLGHFELFANVHAAAGRLLAVAERGIENLDVACVSHGRLPSKVEFRCEVGSQSTIAQSGRPIAGLASNRRASVGRIGEP